MTRYALLSIAILLGAPAAAQDKPAAAQPDSASPKLKALIQNCDAHKFETTVDSVVDGQPHRSKVKMCGTEGQSDAEWIDSLKDAIDKLKANTEMAASTRDQIVDAITSEIARLQSGAAPATRSDSSSLPPPRAAEAKPLSDDYSLLPPIPNASPPPPHVLAPGADAAASDGAATLQTTLSQSGAPPAAVATAPAAQAVAVANPRLSFSCISPEFASGGPCVTLGRDTILMVKAPQAVAAPLSLRFVRQGDARAELALGTMRKGQTLRFELPQPVCAGVVSGEVQMEVVGAGQVLDRQGPYLLRC